MLHPLFALHLVFLTSPHCVGIVYDCREGRGVIYREYTECYSISFLFLFFFHQSSLYPIKIIAKCFYLLVFFTKPCDLVFERKGTGSIQRDGNKARRPLWQVDGRVQDRGRREGEDCDRTTVEYHARRSEDMGSGEKTGYKCRGGPKAYPQNKQHFFPFFMYVELTG